MALAASKPAVALSKVEILRHSRVTRSCQKSAWMGSWKLGRALAFRIGTGGPRAPLGLYLAAAGVGRIGCLESGYRGLLRIFSARFCSAPATWAVPGIGAAADHLRNLNPEIQIDNVRNTYHERERARHSGGDYAIVVDGTDNFSHALSRQ